MKPLIDFSPECLICHNEHFGVVPNWFLRGRRTMRLELVTLFDVLNDDKAVSSMRSIAFDSLPRLMDRFYLWSPKVRPDSEHLSMLTECLFHGTADDFEVLIQPEINRVNIKYLISRLATHFDGKENITVLDYGCGTGLSAEVSIPPNFELVGYDKCQKMRYFAGKKGLKVISPQEFDRIPEAGIDAVFASFILHLPIPRSDLCRLWSLIKPSGILAANFHKGNGVEAVTSIFTQLGANANSITSKDLSIQGPFYEYIK